MLKTIVWVTWLTGMSYCAWGAIGDRFRGNWRANNSGNLDEYNESWPALGSTRQVLTSCRRIDVAVTVTATQLALNTSYNCNPGGSTGSTNARYTLRDLPLKNYREVIQVGSSPVKVVGRLYDSKLDIIEVEVNDRGDMLSVFGQLENNSRMKYRLDWSSVGQPVDTFSRNIAATLTKQ